MHRHRRAILAGVFVLSLMASRSSATTYYIAPSGGSEGPDADAALPGSGSANRGTAAGAPGDSIGGSGSGGGLGTSPEGTNKKPRSPRRAKSNGDLNASLQREG